MVGPISEETAPDAAVRFAALSDVGTERGGNEDACGSHVENATHVLVVLADGVGGEEGGEVASQMAVEATLRAYQESRPSLGAGKRLYRAAQQANIEIYDRAQIVTELRRMSTTLTAVVVDGGTAHVAHVGDSRLYLIRDRAILQKTKDHTVAATKRRVLLLHSPTEKDHPERSTLTRSLGRELIAAVDRIEFPVAKDDVLVLCSDGLYNVLDDEDLLRLAGPGDASAACKALIDAANDRGTPDNVTVAVIRVMTETPLAPPAGWRGLVARFIAGHR